MFHFPPRRNTTVSLETNYFIVCLFVYVFFCLFACLFVKDQGYIQKGQETMEITWELMSLNDGWKTEKVKVKIGEEMSSWNGNSVANSPHSLYIFTAFLNLV